MDRKVSRRLVTLRALVLAALVFGSGTAGAEEKDRLLSSLELKLPPAKRYSLKNGLSVVLEEDHRLPRVAVHVAYRVGQLDDPRGYSGLAHLVEHMSFRGSRHVSPPGSLALLQRLGATTLQGSTGLLETNYHCILPAEQLEDALWIESDRMAFALEKLDATTLEIERAIVSQEIRLRESAGRPYFRHMLRAVFPHGHPYRPQETEIEDLNEIHLRHVQRFMQERYRPDNATLVVVGDFELPRTAALIERYFGPIVPPRLPVKRTVPNGVDLGGHRRVIIGVPVREERMSFVWLTPKVEGPALTSLNFVVGTLVTRLRRTLVDSQALAGFVTADHQVLGHQLLIHLDVALAAKSDPHRVEDEVALELARLHAAPVSQSEFATLRGAHTTDTVSALESIGYRALAGTRDVPFDPVQELRDLGAVDRAAVLASARRYLSQKQRVVVYFSSDRRAPIGGFLVAEEMIQ